MAIAVAERRHAGFRVEIERLGMPARQSPERAAQNLVALRVVDNRGDRQFGLANRHRRRQHAGLPPHAWQYRSGQQIALAEHSGEGWQVRVGQQIGALDVDVRDSAAPRLNHLIARAHHVLSGAQFDLRRPDEIGQQPGDIDGAAGKRADRAVDRRDPLVAHRIEADRARRDWDRVAVLHPQHDLLAGGGRRQSGVTVCRPGIGVMGCGERSVVALRRVGAAVAKGVERIFDDIVPGRSDRVHKQLAAEFGEAKARANLAAVEHDAAGCRSAFLAPFGENFAVAAKQCHPPGGRAAAIARPVIGGGEPGVQTVGVAKKGEIGGKVQRVEIGVPVGQAIGGDAHRVETEAACAAGQISP